MRKQDLKVGMVVEHKNGVASIITEVEQGILLVDSEGRYCRLEVFDENLKSSDTCVEEDIVKVFGFVSNVEEQGKLSLSTSFFWRKLLWKREETVELTLEDIAKLKGCKVENLKIIK